MLFIPFFFIERTLGYDLFGMVGLTGKFIEWGYTVLLLGITILVLPLYWIVYDLQHDPMILGVIVLAVSLWIGYKVLNAYTKHLNK